MDAAERLARYARLVVRVGANVQLGQDVFVLAEVAHTAVARAVAEEAYAVGARRVVVTYVDQHVRRSEILHAPDEALRSAYRYEIEQRLELGERRGALISLTGPRSRISSTTST